MPVVWKEHLATPPAQPRLELLFVACLAVFIYYHWHAAVASKWRRPWSRHTTTRHIASSEVDIFDDPGPGGPQVPR